MVSETVGGYARSVPRQRTNGCKDNIKEGFVAKFGGDVGTQRGRIVVTIPPWTTVFEALRVHVRVFL